jgi:tripartite ATP-independent transporter DctP family solute receptor
MLRRDFLAAGAASLALLGMGGAARAGATVLRLGFTGSRESAIGAGAAALAKAIDKSCEGRIRIELYPGGEAGGEVEMFQDMRAGALEMVHASSAGYASAVAELGVFDIPFLFRDVAHARGVLDSAIGQKALTLLEPVGVVGLSWGENGLRHVTTSDRAVRSPKDLAGLKIRVPQSPVMVAGFKALGADVQALPFPELYAALASGQFQAQENPLATIKDSGFDRVQKYVCLTGHVYSPAMMMISKPAFDALSPEDAEKLRAAAARSAKASRAATDGAEASAIADLRERGMTVVADIDRPAFVAAMAGAEGEFEQRFGKDEINAIRTWKE